MIFRGGTKFESVAYFSFSANKMQAQLDRIREQHVSDANWRTFECIEEVLRAAAVPIEDMRATLRSDARTVSTQVARAFYSVDLSSLLDKSPPLTVYTNEQTTFQTPSPISTIHFTTEFVKSVYGRTRILRLLQHDGLFLGIERIFSQLREAFPDGVIGVSVKGDGKFALEFCVAYDLKTPATIVKY